jgi:hypothetical protein
VKTIFIAMLVLLLAGCASAGSAGCVSPMQGSLMAGCSEGSNPVPIGD